VKRGLAAIVLAALFAAPAGDVRPALGAPPATPSDGAAIVHALSRLGFGPRPGDVERVKSIGLPAWIDRQMDPRRLDDRATEQALTALPTLTMSIAELQSKYPRPKAQEKAADPQMAPRALYDRPPPDHRPARIVGD